MEFAFTPEQERLRREVRQFLNEELGTRRLGADTFSIPSREFSQKLARRGWIGMTWPKEYGGGGASYLDRLVVTEELIRFGAPIGYHWAGDRQFGPSLMKFGSDELKREFLPKIINAEIMIAALLSEPNAGSDLASVQCRAVEDGDEFVIDGQKAWSSWAHVADYGWLVTNSDPQGKRHKNISEFLVDLRKPGVTIHPIIDSTGEHQLNETFFDKYRVSRKYLVGTINEGWYQIAEQVDFERSGIERLIGNWPVFEALVRHVKETNARGEPLRNLPVVRQKLADLKVHFEVGRLLVYRAVWMLSQGKVPNLEASIAKAYGTSFQQQLADVCVDILGMNGLLGPDNEWAPLNGMAAMSYIQSPAYTIQGGANEILRTIIATRGLGLPAR